MFLAKTIRKNTEAVVSFILRRICFEAWIHFNWSFLSLTLLKTASVVLSFGQESKFCSKIEIFFKTRNFVQKSKFWAKIEILVKNRNFGQKSKFWRKIEILFKSQNCGHKSKFWSRIEILVKNRNFVQKSKFQWYFLLNSSYLFEVSLKSNFFVVQIRNHYFMRFFDIFYIERLYIGT